MHTISDDELGHLLKTWAAEYKPPKNGRSHLLNQAAQVQDEKHDYSLLTTIRHFNDYTDRNPNGWSQTLYTWFFVQSIHTGVHARA